MNSGARERPKPAIQFGPPADDPLVARIFPVLSGSVKWGLERTERIMAALGDPHLDYPVLHVGGTNGKGSVARIWAEVLKAAGFRTGLYTSPHLVSFRERILVDGRPLPDELLEEWSRDVRPLLVREAPSFFEAATALAFLAFSRSGVDVAVVEVGMGGRLDATNVVEPVLTAVTNVSLDHIGMLGETLEQIAREKAGILKPGTPVFTAVQEPTALAVLTEEAALREALLCCVPMPKGLVGLDGSEFRVVTKNWGTLDLESPLTGRHQLHNLGVAVAALEALPPRLPVSVASVKDGIGRAHVPGRFQVEREGSRTWILDIAHNLSGVQALTSALAEMEPPRPLVGIVGILSDKPWGGMLDELAVVIDTLILTTPLTALPSRAWDPEAAARNLPSEQVETIPGIDAAIEAARKKAGPYGTVVVTGSTYTVGEALRCLNRIPAEALPVPFDSG